MPEKVADSALRAGRSWGGQLSGARFLSGLAVQHLAARPVPPPKPEAGQWGHWIQPQPQAWGSSVGLELRMGWNRTSAHRLGQPQVPQRSQTSCRAVRTAVQAGTERRSCSWRQVTGLGWLAPAPTALLGAVSLASGVVLGCAGPELTLSTHNQTLLETHI